VRPDGARASSFNVAYSIDGAPYIAIPAFDYISPAGIVDDAPFAKTASLSATLTGVTIPAGQAIFIRWSGAPVSGSGANDEFGIDNVSIVAGNANTGPSLTAIADQTTRSYTPNQVAFTISDLETAPENLVVTATSSNPAVVPNGNLVLGGSGANRTLTATPIVATGYSDITVRVTDPNGLSSVYAYRLELTAAPSLSIPQNLTAGQGQFDLVQIPVKLNSNGLLPSTLESLTLALTYDTNALSIEAVTTGDLTDDPGLNTFLLANRTEPGKLTIAMAVPGGITGNVNGDVAIIHARVKSNAPPGATRINLRESLVMGSGGTISTGLNDGMMVLGPPPTNSEIDPLADGLLTIVANQPPTLTQPAPMSVPEDVPQSITLTGLTAGGESQALAITATTTNLAGNPDQSLIPNPVVTYSSGTEATLQFTPVANLSGTAVVNVLVRDAGPDGTINTGDDGFVTRSFEVVVNPVNDAPTLAVIDGLSLLEDAGAQTVNLSGLSAGGGESQALTIVAESDNPTLVPNPSVTHSGQAATGTLQFTPQANRFGTANITVTVRDAGLDGIAGNSDDESFSRTFSVQVTPVNDAPSFVKGADVTVLEDAGAQNLAAWATSILPGPHEADTVQFEIVSNTNELLFAEQPAIAADGRLTFRAAAHASGSATIGVRIQDDGGTAGGGVNQSEIQTFVINVTAVNDAPSFVKGADVTVLEDSGPRTIANWATALSAGPNETQNLSFAVVDNSNATLFAVGPAITADGQLSFTPAANAFGSATITIRLDDDGGTAHSGVNQSGTQTFVIQVTNVNDAPSFTKGPDQAVLEDSGPHNIEGWATAILAGVGGETDALTFNITDNTNAALFASGPTIAANGTLSYTLAPHAVGNATITFTLSDDGGTANSGSNVSGPQSFVIAVGAVNDAPSFVKGPDQTLLEDSGPQTVSAWATAILSGPGESDAVTFEVTNNTNPTLFAVAPAISSTGELTYTPAANAFGTATITIRALDNGGTANGGVNASQTQTFVIHIMGVNDAPSFVKGPDVTVLEDSGSRTIEAWATALSAGLGGETDDVSFTVTDVSDPGLFSAAPAIASNGSLTFTPAPHAFGSATISVRMNDDGGTANGGVNQSEVQTFTIQITNVNDAPSFVKGADQTVLEDSGAHSVPGWATGIVAGPGESDDVTFAVTSNTNEGLFAVQPAISPTGTLTYTLAANAFGSATITLRAQDNGGTASSGVNQSGTQTLVINVTNVNDAPSFTPTAEAVVLEDSGPANFPAFLTAISAGLGGETDDVSFTMTDNTNPGLFAVPPSLSSSGALTFTPAENASGFATVSVRAGDNGGTANSGVNQSAVQTFVIRVTNVNDAPSFVKGANQTVLEDTGPQTVTGWATAISSGPGEANDVTFQVTGNTNSELFSAGPAVDAAGNLTYTLAPQAHGTATITLVLNDNGGTENGGVNASAGQTFTITATPVNDAPTFVKGSDVTVGYNSGQQTVAAWATAIAAGPPNENGQALSFVVSVETNPGLFATPPAVASDGTLTFTPSSGLSGSATIAVTLHDNAGTDNGGVAASNTQTFVITVSPEPVNVLPTIDALGPITVLEDAAAQIVSLTGITAGGESQQLKVTSTSSQPALVPHPLVTYTSASTTGTLTFQPVAHASGSATITVKVQDAGFDGQLDTADDGETTTMFVVNVTPVNDAPSFTRGPNVVSLEDAGPQSIDSWATGISSGPGESDSLTFEIVENTNPGLFSALPILSSTGALTYTSAPHAFGAATITVRLRDDGGTANGGSNVSAEQTFTIEVTPVNDAPSFVKGPDQAVLEDAAPQTVDTWATAISPGPGESDTVTFVVTDITNPGLFAVAPAIDSSGKLTYTPSAHASGTATITVLLSDNGGNVDGGVHQSATQTFVISVQAVNDAPSFVKGPDQSVLEDADPQSIADWATAISSGPGESDTLNFSVTDNTNSALFAVGPAISAEGTLTYTLAANASGSATITVRLNDGGGTANGGVNTSATQSFTITATPVNDAPSFVKGPDLSLPEDSGPQVVPAWATAISAGPVESDALQFEIVGNSRPELFAVAPALSSTGDLTFTPQANASGSATITIQLKDDGGTANNGSDTSATQTFTIDLVPSNDAPTLDPLSPLTLPQDAAPHAVSLTGISAGGGESQALVVTASSSDPSLVSPAVTYTSPDATGTLTLTLAPGESGTATITVTVRDAGLNGIAGDGDDGETTRTFTVEVSPFSLPPTALDANYNTPANTPLSGVAGAIDPDSTTLTYAVVMSPAAGTLMAFDAATGAFTYQPATGFSGVDLFTFSVSDGITTDVGTIRIVTPGTQAVVTASDGNIQVTGGTAANLVIVSRGTAGKVLVRTNSASQALPLTPITGQITITGSEFRDNITISSLNNPAHIEARGGDDYIATSQGNDVISGGAGNDTIQAMDGENIVWGDEFGEPEALPGGNDFITTGAGNDVIYGGGGNDRLNAGDGHDYVHGGAGDDQLSGQGGDDRLYGSGGNDTLAGDQGNDLLLGGAGNDTLLGRAGSDVIIGGAGADQLLGDVDHDLMVGGDTTNSQSLSAGDANDLALQALLASWLASHTANLASSILAADDGQVDRLTGSSGDDDFYLGTGDIATDYLYSPAHGNDRKYP
jgi:hypothetical protein